MELNNTPVRTSKNFNINNIKLDFEIPQNIKSFDNVEVSCASSSMDEDLNFVYGVGLDFKNSNHKVNINLKDGDNARIVYTFDDDNLNLVNELLVHANGDSSLTIVYNSKTTKHCFHNGGLKIIANDGARLNVNVINFLNEDSDSFENIENVIGKNSKVSYTIVDLGGKNSITNYYADIKGESAENDLKTIYLGTDNQLKDINYIAELRGKKTNVDIDVQGALAGSAKKNFKGTIDFKSGCKKSKGNENEFCMLLSDKAKSIALPMLLCSEDDVEGNHSTASGKVDNKVLFYVMSRGLSYKEAVKLLVKSNFTTIIDRISDETLKEEVIRKIDEKLD